MGKKDQQLGMNFSTASHRLHKMVLLDLLQRYGEADCFRCGELIETTENLSIEHKVAWQDVDPALFWDLSNITWSHRSCNSRAGKKLGGLPWSEARKASRSEEFKAGRSAQLNALRYGQSRVV